MKNFFKSLAICALAALTFASCQKENAGGNMDDQSSVVSINLTSPLMGTKAFADGTTVDVVHVHVYKVGEHGELTYIEPGRTGSTATPSQDVEMSGGRATYSTRLVTGQTYTFVFWAEKSSEENYNSPYTYDSANQTITVNYDSATGNDERRDAFYAVLPEVKITGAYSHSVKLQRPFAQVNFGVTQADMDAAKDAGFIVSKAAVKCTNVAKTLNLLTGAVSDGVTATFALTNLPSQTLSAANKTYKYVAMNYVLVGSTLSDITLTLEANDPVSAAPEYTYSNVPLQGNYRTNIVGDLFTSPASINITVDSDFEGDNNKFIPNVSSIEAANDALANGATNINITNITTSEAATTNLQMPATPESINISIESIESSANLTINQPTTGSNPASVAVTIPSSASVAQLTINLPQSHVEINGASYNSITATTSNNTLVIGKDVTVETLTIEAGAVEIYGNVGTLVNNNNKDVKVWAVGDKANFTKAYNAGAKTIELKNNIEDFSSVIEINRDLTIDGKGFEIWNTANRVIRITESSSSLNITFKNLGIISKCSASADVRAISFDDNCPPSTVVFNACTVSASFYAINIIPGSQGHNITIKNTTVAGWAAINCYANNSTFNVENSTLIGLNDKSESPWNDYATIIFDGNGLYNATNIGKYGTGNTLNVVNSTIYASSESSNNQAWITLQYGAQRNSVKVDAATRIIDGSENDQTNNIAMLNYVGYDSETETATLYDLESEIWIGNNNLFPGMYEQNGVYHIVNSNGLLYFASKVNDYNNSFSGKTVLLDADVDLEGAEWAPIGPNADDNSKKFKGVFEGADHTISNFVINQGAAYHAAGFFGALNGTVQNLKFKDVTVKSISAGNSDGNTDNGTAIVAGSIYQSGLIDNVSITNCSVEGNRYVGGIAGYVYGSITGCKADKVNVTAKCDELTGKGKWDNGDKAGVIVGYYAGDNTSTSIENNTVKTSSVTAYRDFGGIAGSALDGANALVKNNRVYGLTLTVDKTHNYKNYTQQSEHNVHGAIGRGGDGVDNTTNNVTIVY